MGRAEAATLLSRYRRANHRITFRILDPALVPGEAERLGVTEIGSAAVQDPTDPDRIEVAQYTIEIDLTSAIARLVRGIDATVCFTTGHGERQTDDRTREGLSEAREILVRNGYRTRAINLLARPEIEGCDAAVIAAPSSSLAPEARRALDAYLRSGGKAFLMSDPDADGDLTPVGRPWGIRFIRGVVLEADPGSHLPGDVTAPIVSRYAGGSPPVRGLGPTFFPRAMGVEARETGDPGLSVTAVALTSPLAYLDTEDVASFDPAVDRRGPVAIGAAADASEVEGRGTERPRIRRTRVFAWGDVDFVSNAYISEAANARLWVQGVDWLTQPEDLVAAVPNFPKVRELNLTEARSRYLLTLQAGLIPGLFLVAGALVWVVRRGR